MKKKLNISVVDIVNRVTSPKNASLPINNKAGCKNQQQSDGPLVVDRPMRFEDLYRKVVEESGRGLHTGDSCSLKIVYDSKKTTPVNTCRGKKMSLIHSGNNSSKTAPIASITRTAKRSVPSLTSAVPISDPFPHQSQQPSHPNSHNRQQTSSISKRAGSKQNIRTPPKPFKSPFQCPILEKLNQYIEGLNHEQHTHLRENNQCFLSEREIDDCMGRLGYDIRHFKYGEFLALLEVDIYGGAPCQNLKKIIKIIEEKKVNNPHYNPSLKRKMPKIIDNNLKVNISEESKQFIVNYFADFALIGSQQKQNEGIMANIIHNKNIQSFQNLLKQKNLKIFSQKQQQQTTALSPGKKINSTAISQLIQQLNQSSQKNSCDKIAHKIDVSNKKQQRQVQNQDMQTFRKVESQGFQGEVNQYNFSRELTGDRVFQGRQDQNIVHLKNKLNQALKKSSDGTNHFFSQDRQYNSFLYSNSLKYSKKPILSVDVNLGEGVSQKIIVFEGETAKQVSERLAKKFTISCQTKLKFEKMLESHLNTMLWKIQQVSEDMLTDREAE